MDGSHHDAPAGAPIARFATYVATLGRGQGRSRALTRDEARDAFRIVLDGGCDPHQLGAFLMLLRYRGEDPDEITGLVQAARDAIGPLGIDADLDWPSYGSGRTRGAPWFLLSALALAASGTRVLMHGTNEFTGGITLERALDAIGLAPASDPGDAARLIGTGRFAYLPLERLSPRLSELIGLRHLLGLRSPVNTVARLIDPASVGVSVDGVFHPPYIEVHLAVAELLSRRHLAVLKGGGGEAERAPARPTELHRTGAGRARSVLLLPALVDSAPRIRAGEDTTALFRAVWTGEASPPDAVATVTGTIAMALLALDPALGAEEADAQAVRIWARRAPT